MKELDEPEKRIHSNDSSSERSRIGKLLFAGSGAVGKTSLMTVFKANKSLSDILTADSKYHRTLFYDIDVLTPSGLKNCPFPSSLQMVDIAGQLDLPIHALRDMPRTTLGSVDLVLFVFACDNLQSLFELVQWLEMIDEYYSANNLEYPNYALVCNKTDLEAAMDDQLIDEVLNSNPRFKACFKVSCMTGEGLEELRGWIERNVFLVGENEE